MPGPLAALGSLFTGGALLGNLFSGMGSQRWQKKMAQAQLYSGAQIRAKDLEAAGLSKTLAAGSTASAPTSITTPQVEGNPAETAMGLMTQEKDIAVKDQQINSLKAQAALNKANKDFLKDRSRGQVLSNANQNLKNIADNYNLQWYMSKNLPLNYKPGGVAGLGTVLGGALLDALKGSVNTKGKDRKNNPPGTRESGDTSSSGRPRAPSPPPANAPASVWDQYRRALDIFLGRE